MQPTIKPDTDNSFHISLKPLIDGIVSELKGMSFNVGYNPDEYITTEELSKRLNLSENSYKSTISRWRNPKHYDPPLPAIKASKTHSFKWSDVVVFVDRHLRTYK